MIVGDTIYYFGGAASIGSFPIQQHFRKGVINPENPTEITWTIGTIANNSVGYRMGATSVGENIYWIGGSGVTYNFNGIAYNGSGGVPTLNRILSFNTTTNEATTENYDLIPMDLRGIASVNDSVKYVIGGMVDNQKVSNQLFKLVLKGDNTTSNKNISSDHLSMEISPNPVDDILHLRVNSSKVGPANISIFDELGQMVLSQSSQLTTGENTLELAADKLNNGWYILSVETKEGRVYEKMMIMK